MQRPKNQEMVRSGIGPVTRVAGISVVGILALMIWGCGDDASGDGDPDGGGSDAANGDSDADTDTDADTDADTDGDTDEDETPPDLPSRCTATQVQYLASSTGDTQDPSILGGQGPRLVWTHEEQGAQSDWRIQITEYDPTEYGDTNSDTDPQVVGPTYTIPNTGPLSRNPLLAADGAIFALAWLDDRVDPDCDDINWLGCKKEIMFLRVDAMGQAVDGALPTQVTDLAPTDDNVYGVPALAVTATGYLLVWYQKAPDGMLHIMARALDKNGDFIDGAAHSVVAETERMVTQKLQLAVLNDVGVVAWIAGQRTLKSKTLAPTGAPTPDPVQIVESGVMSNRVQMVAGKEGFMLSLCRSVVSDFEIYTTKLDAQGKSLGFFNRATYTRTDILDSSISWDPTTEKFALSWSSSTANGEDGPVFDHNKNQIFSTILDLNGAVASVPVLLSNSPNPTTTAAVAWDGVGWTSIWVQPGNNRTQVFVGQMTCN